jgi:hypothetical protein
MLRAETDPGNRAGCCNAPHDRAGGCGRCNRLARAVRSTRRVWRSAQAGANAANRPGIRCFPSRSATRLCVREDLGGQRR